METDSQKLEHDIKSALSSLQSGIEVACDEWKTNPELVERILPLMIDKLKILNNDFKNYNQKK